MDLGLDIVDGVRRLNVHSFGGDEYDDKEMTKTMTAVTPSSISSFKLLAGKH